MSEKTSQKFYWSWFFKADKNVRSHQHIEEDCVFEKQLIFLQSLLRKGEGRHGFRAKEETEKSRLRPVW